MFNNYQRELPVDKSLDIAMVYFCVFFGRLVHDHIIVDGMAAIEVNEYGQPVSRNATFGHRRGSLARTHVPVSFKSWDDVPPNCKEDIWRTLKAEYNVDESSKDNMLKAACGPWRRFKSELLTDYYDTLPTHEERILNVPPGVQEEDWIKFCENERED